MPQRKTGHGTPAEGAVSAVQPFVSTHTTVTARAFPIGRSMYGGQPYDLDPVTWMKKGEIESTNGLLFAKRNHGKSGALKKMVINLGVGKTRKGNPPKGWVDTIRYIDGKGEYDKLAGWYDCTPVRPTTPLNLFDPQLNLSAEANLTTALDAFTVAGEGARPRTDEAFAIQVAMDMMYRDELRAYASFELLGVILSRLTYDDAERHLQSDLVGGLKNMFPGEELPGAVAEIVNRSTNMRSDTFLFAADQATKRFDRLLRGDFGKRFGGKGSIADMFDQRMVVVDFTGMNDATIAYLQSFFWRLKRHALLVGDERFIYQRELHDENYKMWNYEPYAIAVSDFLKQLRGYESVPLFATHRPNDYLGVGEAGSRVRELATNFIKDVGFYIIGRLNRPDAEQVSELVGLDVAEVERIVRLKPGEFGVKRGTEPIDFVNFFDLTPDEVKDVIETNTVNEELYQQNL